MGHYAKIVNNIVQEVIVADSKEWCEENLGGQWEQTSYNTIGGVHLRDRMPFRYNYAGVGYIFDPEFGSQGAFYEPQPYPSWTLNQKTALWEAPVPKPEDSYTEWNETTQQWETPEEWV